MRLLRLILPYTLILIAAYVALHMTGAKHQKDIQICRNRYVVESHAQTEQVAGRIQISFNEMYQGLRTMARLPGVRSIDRYADHFEANAKSAVQEIYNNLGSNVAMSEVYIVPQNIEPDQIDSRTHKLQTPITTFDHLIINRTADGAHQADEKSEVEEIEIYEYRLMKKQIAIMKQICPTENAVHGLAYPAISGPEVITCDNSRYSVKHPDDKDRSGLVYSVPFFDPNGVFKGMISGVILTHALRDLIPDGNYAWINTRQNYAAMPNVAGGCSESIQAISIGLPNTHLIYSEALPLQIRDMSGSWAIWVGIPDSVFWSRADVKAAEEANSASVHGIIFAAALFIILTIFVQRLFLAIKHNAEAVASTSETLTRFVGESEANSRSVAISLTEVSEGCRETAAIAQHVAAGCDEETRTLSQANQLMAELSEMI
jgi:hypothetical protein